MIRKRNRKFILLIIIIMLAATLIGTGPISADDEISYTALNIPVISIDSEQFQQLGSVSIPLADVENIPAEGEALTIKLPAGCVFNGIIGDVALESGLIIEYTNILEISSEKIADNEVKLMVTGDPGADQEGDREGNAGSILLHFASVKVTAGFGNIDAEILSSGVVFPEMITAPIALISEGSTEPPAETGTDPDDPEDDNPGDDISGDDTPGDDSPGDDTPGDDTPGNDDPDEFLPPDPGDSPEEPELIAPQTADDPEQIFMTELMQLDEKKAELDNARSKLETRLLQLIDENFLSPGKSKSDLIREMQKAGQLSKETYITRSEAGEFSAQAFVYIDLMPGSDISEIDPYVSEIVNSSSEYNLAAAWVQVSELEKLAGLGEVRSISIVEPPVHNTGTVTSQGDIVHRANLFRGQTGEDGTGIKVGIISDGVSHWTTSRDSGDLPADLHVLSDTIGGDEGTAMLEIVHDLAPGAELYFHDCGNNILAFNNAVSELAAAGCNIICDDIGWITQPFFEDGAVAQHVASVIDNYNIIYVSSAGNAGVGHYQGLYYRAGGYDHAISLYVNLPPGSSVRAVLEWNDRFGHSANDYDFYLLNYATGDTLALSNVRQKGSQDPLEFIQYTNNTGAVLDGELKVVNYRGQASQKILEMYVYGANGAGLYLDNRVTADSIFGHAAVPDVITCGAVRASDPDEIEYFSSRGPVTMLKETRQKPDFVGTDGVAVTGAGGFPSPFYGTSAAAPHIAAIAALGWSQDLTRTAAQVKEKMMTGAVDLGSTGYDDIFGYGKPDAVKSFPAMVKNIKGCARYENSAGDHSGITVTAKADTSVIDTAATDNSGLFEMTLPDGTYTLEFTLPGYLKTIIENVPVADSLTEVSTVSDPIVMKAGDIDGSGLIDLSDLGLLANSYGANSSQANYLQAADFDRSQLIDLSDLGFLASHYGESTTDNPLPLSIGTGSLPGAFQNQPFAGHIFTASGGTAPYSFEVTGGSLPSGMSMSSSGYLSGTPAESGTFNFTVTVTDGASETDSHDFTLTVSSSLKGWTIMMYCDADNYLEYKIIDDLKDVRGAVTNDVNLIALVDRIPGYSSDSSILKADFTDTRLFNITRFVITRIGGGTQFPEITTTSNYEANMGDANNLKKFIQFCKANYPADHYALIIPNHSDGGFRSIEEVFIENGTNIENGICSDSTNGDTLYTAEISDVLGTSENVDLLVFDVSMMGTTEAAYQYRPGNGGFAADVMIASAAAESLNGINYYNTLLRLNTNGGNNGQNDSTMGGMELNYDPASMTAKQFGGIIVEEYRDSAGSSLVDQTLACFDLSKIGAVKTAFDALVRELYTRNERNDLEAIRGSGSNTLTMKYFNAADEAEWIKYPYFDFYDLCRRINSSANFDTTIRSKAAAVMTAIDEAVVYSYGGSSYSNFTNGQNGLSLFFPDGARLYSESKTAMWVYQWWYNSIDINAWWPSHFYGKLDWCADGQNPAVSTVGNWFEMLDAWYEPWGNGTDGGCNGYRW